MNKSGKRIIKNNKKYNTEKKERKIVKSPTKNKIFLSKNKFPHDSSYNVNTNLFNISNNEENVIANILKTNNVNNDSFKNKEKENQNNEIKHLKKTSGKSININKDYKEIGDFNFINISTKVKPFLYKPKKSNEYSSHNYFYFLDIVITYRMIINILIDDDSLKSSNNLLKIFESLFLSLNSLGEINISNKDFLVCIFFQHFSNEETFKDIFPGLHFYNCNNWNLKVNNFYCSYGDVLSVNETPINVLIFYKESATYVEIYKFFYCNVLNDLITLINVDSKEIGKTFLIVNWPNGKIYEKSSNKYHKSRILSNIFRICNNRNMILIPDINYFPYNKKDYFGYIHRYNINSDKIHVNLLWDMMCEYPIDHRFFFINMNYKLYLILKEYYQNKISIYSNEFYHDYHLSAYLKSQTKNIVIQKIKQVKIEYNGLSSNLINFFFNYTLERGSEYANSFSLICYLFSWKNMTFLKFLQKFVLFFKLISFLVEFFWVGLSLLISYAVFNETFGTNDNKIDYLCCLGYSIIVILLLFISTIYIKNKPRIKQNIIYRNVKRNKESFIIVLILYIIHYAYNIFFIACAIIAVIHVENGKNEELDNDNYYIFNKDYFLLLLLLNILFVILPNFIRPSNLISFGFLLYLVFQLPNSTCFFHIPYLFTSTRNINSRKKSIESLYITLYIFLNGLLTVICIVFDTKRKRRMDFFYILAIIMAILKGVNLIIIIIGFCKQNKFNKEISTGRIPQYNIANIEYDNNLYDNNNIINISNNNIVNSINNNILNKSNSNLIKIDNLRKNESEGYFAVQQRTYEKKSIKNIFHQEFKNLHEDIKEYSNRTNIVKDNQLMFKHSKESNTQNKVKKLNNKNNPILQIDENKKHLNKINNKKGIESNYKNKSFVPNKIEQELYINNINPNPKRNDNQNDIDLKGINYPLDTESINNNNNYENSYNKYETNYCLNYENNYDNDCQHNNKSNDDN